jgi:hypothetical protein
MDVEIGQDSGGKPCLGHGKILEASQLSFWVLMMYIICGIRDGNFGIKSHTIFHRHYLEFSTCHQCIGDSHV